MAKKRKDTKPIEFRLIFDLRVGYREVTSRALIDSILATVGSDDDDVTGLFVMINVEENRYPEVWGYSGIPYAHKKAWLIYREAKEETPQ